MPTVESGQSAEGLINLVGVAMVVHLVRKNIYIWQNISLFMEIWVI